MKERRIRIQMNEKEYKEMRKRVKKESEKGDYKDKNLFKLVDVKNE